MPFATWRPIPSHGGPMRAQRGLIEHITTNNADPFGFFSNPAHGASSHLWIALDGSLEQYIDLRLQSWAQMAGNPLFTSVEISGMTGTAKTPAQSETLARLWAWGHTHPELQWPLQLTSDPNIGGLGWHGMSPTFGHPFCPGDARRAQRPDVLSRALAIAGGDVIHTPPAPAPAPIPVPEDIDMLIVECKGMKVLLLDKPRQLGQTEYVALQQLGVKEIKVGDDFFARKDPA